MMNPYTANELDTNIKGYKSEQKLLQVIISVNILFTFQGYHWVMNLFICMLR